MLTKLFDKERRFTLISAVIVISWFISAIFYSLSIAVKLPTTHLDGAFQAASGLFRLDAGQFPGRDFFPYLGIGPLYLLFPVYKLFGSDLAASVIASYLVVAVAVMVSAAFIFHLIWKPKSTLTSLAVSCILFYAVSVIYFVFHFGSLSWGLMPGNSLRPLRSFVPYLSGIFLYLLFYRGRIDHYKYAAAGLLTAIVLLWSNDFAFSTGILLVVFLFAHLVYQGERVLKNFTWYVVTALLGWGVLFYWACHGHPVEMMKYNFADAAQDQWWYFGPYGENTRIFSWHQFMHLIYPLKLIGLLVFGALLFHAFKFKSKESVLLCWVGVSLYAGGAIASVGGHSDPGYFAAYRSWLWSTALIGGLRLILYYTNSNQQPATSNQQPATTLAGVAFLFLAISASMAYVYYQKTENAIKDAKLFYVPELGGYLSKDWADYVLLARSRPSNTIVIEEYWGVWSALRRTFSDWPVDSVIHALGNTRNRAKINMENADMVISTKRTGYQSAIEWQPWSVSSNYWFYEQLLDAYGIASFSPNTIVWTKNKVTKLKVLAQCKPDQAGNYSSLKLAIPSAGYYEIEMQYFFSGNRRSLVMVQNNINYASDSNGYISINPRANEIKFPAYFKSIDAAQLGVNLVGDAHAQLNITSCIARKIDFSNEEVLSSPPIERRFQ